MKILYNLISGSIGGQITRANAIIDRVDSYDIELIIIKNENVILNCKKKNIQYINVKHSFGLFRFIERLYWESFILPKIIKEKKPDLFLTFSNYLPICRFKIPTYMGISNLAPFSSFALKEESIKNRIKFYIIRKSIIYSSKNATKIIALSNTAVDVLSNYGINYDKIFLNPIGVDDFWSKVVPNDNFQLEYGINKPFYLYVSHFYRYKNHIRLIHAYAKLKPEIVSNRQMVFIGRPENIEYFEELKKIISSYKLESKIILISGLDSFELRKFYQNCYIFIFSSLVENCPNILLEAMKASCPILTVNIDPMVEYCSNCAEFFDGKSIDNLVNKLEYLDQSKLKLDRMKIASYQQSKLYSWDLFVEKLFSNMKLHIN
jgi:glycosyltransferase involved in cell wall biosynthesis